MPPAKPDVRVVSDLDELERAAAGEMARLLRKARPQQPFAVALAGGRTPSGMYARLTREPYRALMPWPRLHLFFGDERCVPPEHADSNYRMVSESLISKAPVPPQNVHRITAENPDAEAAARGYETDLRAYFGLKEAQLPRFGLVLLGLGSDGHVASLFPGSAALRVTDRLVAAVRVEAPQPQRITLTPPVIRNAAALVLLVSGVAKSEALKRALAPDGNTDDCPARILKETRGTVVVIADREAAQLL